MPLSRLSDRHLQTLRGPKLSGGSQIRRDIGLDPFEFFRGERKFAPAFEEFTRAIARDGGITAEQKAVHSDLAHSPGQQRSVSFPHTGDGNAGHVKVEMPYAGISAFECVGIYGEGLVGCDRSRRLPPDGRFGQ